MSKPAIEVHNLSKRYKLRPRGGRQLGPMGATTLRDSVQRWGHDLRNRWPLRRLGVKSEIDDRFSANVTLSEGE